MSSTSGRGASPTRRHGREERIPRRRRVVFRVPDDDAAKLRLDLEEERRRSDEPERRRIHEGDRIDFRDGTTRALGPRAHLAGRKTESLPTQIRLRGRGSRDWRQRDDGHRQRYEFAHHTSSVAGKDVRGHGSPRVTVGT